MSTPPVRHLFIGLKNDTLINAAHIVWVRVEGFDYPGRAVLVVVATDDGKQITVPYNTRADAEQVVAAIGDAIHSERTSR